MDPKGLFLSFLSPHCMCGPTFEVNIQCLLPILPAVSHRLNFVLRGPHSNWAHQNCLFPLLNKQNIALGPWPNLTCFSEDSRETCYMLQRLTGSLRLRVSCGKHQHYGELIFPGKTCFLPQNLLVNYFILMSFTCNKNSPKGEFKPGPKSGHPSVR